MLGSTRRPKATRRKFITADQINAGGPLLDKLSRLRGGRGTFSTPFGPMVAQPGTGFRIGITSSSGIPAGSGYSATGDITLGYAADVSDCYVSLTQPGTATVVITSQDFDGYNLSSSAVAGNALTIYMWLWNMWICIWEDCSQSGS
jgi:hypothetical protein